MAHVWRPGLMMVTTAVTTGHSDSSGSPGLWLATGDNLTLSLAEIDITHAPSRIPSGHDEKREANMQIWGSGSECTDQQWPMMNADVTVAGQSGASRGVTSKQTFRMGDHHTSANIIPPAFCNQDPVNTHIYMQGQWASVGPPELNIINVFIS